MNVLKEIVHWFLHGHNGQNHVEASVETPPIPFSKPMVKKQAEKQKSNEMDFDLFKGSNRTTFLDDLKSIEPLSKQFSKAREEILEELKKLDPQQRNGHRPH